MPSKGETYTENPTLSFQNYRSLLTLRPAKVFLLHSTPLLAAPSILSSIKLLLYKGHLHSGYMEAEARMQQPLEKKKKNNPTTLKHLFPTQ